MLTEPRPVAESWLLAQMHVLCNLCLWNCMHYTLENQFFWPFCWLILTHTGLKKKLTAPSNFHKNMSTYNTGNGKNPLLHYILSRPLQVSHINEIEFCKAKMRGIVQDAQLKANPYSTERFNYCIAKFTSEVLTHLWSLDSLQKCHGMDWWHH